MTATAQPAYGIATFLLEDGARAVAKTDDPTTLALIRDGEPLGAAARLDGQGSFVLA